jgi:hypothetical protein
MSNLSRRMTDVAEIRDFFLNNDVGLVGSNVVWPYA